MHTSNTSHEGAHNSHTKTNAHMISHGVDHGASTLVNDSNTSDDYEFPVDEPSTVDTNSHHLPAHENDEHKFNGSSQHGTGGHQPQIIDHGHHVSPNNTSGNGHGGLPDSNGGHNHSHAGGGGSHGGDGGKYLISISLY